jgi:hypothetical protein
MKRIRDRFGLGSALALRASDRPLVIATLSRGAGPWSEEDFGEGTAISTRDTCAPRSFRFVAHGTRST